MATQTTLPSSAGVYHDEGALILLMLRRGGCGYSFTKMARVPPKCRCSFTEAGALLVLDIASAFNNPTEDTLVPILWPGTRVRVLYTDTDGAFQSSAYANRPPVLPCEIYERSGTPLLQPILTGL